MKAKDAFIISLKSDVLPAWSPSGANARNEAASLYGDFFFPSEQLAENASNDGQYHPNVVSKGCGVIGASSVTIMKAEEFNVPKANFDKSLDPMRGVLIEVNIDNGQTKRQMALDRAALKACRIAILSERQACRRILICKNVPEKIAFLWVIGNSSNKITAAEVKARLKDMTVSPDVASDLRALDKLENDEPLVFVKELNQHLRVKIGTYGAPKKVRVPKKKKVLKEFVLSYKQHATSMPVLIQMTPGQSLPIISAPRGYPGMQTGDIPGPAEEKNKPQLKRKIEQTPYLKTLNIYRYQENFREEYRNSVEWQNKLAGQDKYHS